MTRISQLSEQIREHTYKWNSNIYERHYKNCPDEWNMLCVAMDTLDDTCIALEEYESQGIGHDEGEKYLKLYGLLQAVFLQQDSIRHLHQIFIGKPLETVSDSAWTEIRELRNLTVGHPIEKKGKSGTMRCYISRVTIRDEGFQLIVWNKENNKDEIVQVDLQRLYESYKLGAIAHLESIYEAQVAKWNAPTIT